MAYRKKLLTLEQLKSRSEQYFVKCAEKKVKPTLTGLVLNLKLAGKSDLKEISTYSQAHLKEVRKACTRVAHAYEKTLHEKRSCVGAIFALKNIGRETKDNFEDNSDIDITTSGKAIKPKIVFTELKTRKQVEEFNKKK